MFFVNVSTKALELKKTPNENSEVLDTLHVGGVIRGSYKFLHDGLIWIKVISTHQVEVSYVLDEAVFNGSFVEGGLIQIPGTGASPWSCLYLLRETIQVFSKPSMLSNNNKKSLSPYRVIEIIEYHYDESTRTMWGRMMTSSKNKKSKDTATEQIDTIQNHTEIINNDDTSIETESNHRIDISENNDEEEEDNERKLSPSQEQQHDNEKTEDDKEEDKEEDEWIILSEVCSQKSKLDCFLKLQVIDLALGDPFCFRNIYIDGEVPIRAEPNNNSNIVEILPSFISIQARESQLTEDGELWAHLSSQFKPFVDGWVQVVKENGTMVLDPFSIDNYRTAEDCNHPRNQNNKHAHLSSSSALSRKWSHDLSWLIEGYQNDGSERLFFRNILSKAALPFREDPILSSPVIARLPLGGCIQGAGERLLTKEGQVWARCVLRQNNKSQQEQEKKKNKKTKGIMKEDDDDGNDEAVWAVERNAKDGTTILNKIRCTFKIDDQDEMIIKRQKTIFKKMKLSSSSSSNNKNQHFKDIKSHHQFGIVYIVRHEGELPILSTPGYGEDGCKELGQLSNGSLFIATERKLNLSRSPPSMWIHIKPTDEITLKKYESYISSSHSSSSSLSLSFPSTQPINLKFQNPFTMNSASTSTSTSTTAASTTDASNVPSAPPASMYSMYDAMRCGGGWVPESLGGISSSVEELSTVVPFHIDDHLLFRQRSCDDDDKEVSSDDENETNVDDVEKDSDDDDIDDDDMVVYVDSPVNQSEDIGNSSFPDVGSKMPKIVTSSSNSLPISNAESELDWLSNTESSSSSSSQYTAIDTIKEMKKMRMKLEEEARKEKQLLKKEEEKKEQDKLKEKKLKEMKKLEEIRKNKEAEERRLRLIKEAEDEKKRLQGEAELKDLLDALDSFTEEDSRRAEDRRNQDAIDWNNKDNKDSEFNINTPCPIVSPRGNYYLGALTVKLRRPPRPPGSNPPTPSPAVVTALPVVSFFSDSEDEDELEAENDAGIRIYYTTDGSDPNPRFSLSEPLEISVGPGVTHIKAIACGNGMKPSKVVHAKFIVYGDGYGKCCLVDLGIRCHHFIFRTGLVQKVRSKVFWPKRQRKQSYAPLSKQSSSPGSGVLYDDDNDEDDDEFNTSFKTEHFDGIDENDDNDSSEKKNKKKGWYSNKKKNIMLRLNNNYKSVRKIKIGGGGLDARSRSQYGSYRTTAPSSNDTSSSPWSRFKSAIGMHTPRDAYTNVDYEGEF